MCANNTSKQLINATRFMYILTVSKEAYLASVGNVCLHVYIYIYILFTDIDRKNAEMTKK